MPPQQLDQDIVRLARAVRKVESGENFQARGGSGEFGGYQYTPATWAAHAAKAGVTTPLEQASREEQNKVFYTWAKSKKDEGRNVGEIASMHNAGEGRPNAYIEGNKGVNKHGVEYDTAAYARKVAEEYQRQKQSGNSGDGYITSSTLPEPSPEQVEQAQKPGLLEGLGQKLAGRVGDAGEAVSGTFSGQVNPLRGLLRTVGAAAGGVGDVVGTALSAITPDFIEKPVTEGVGKFVGGALNTPTGQGLVQGYQNLDPEIRKDLGAAGNIVSLFPIGKGAAMGVGAAKATVPTAVRVAAKTDGLIGDAARKSLVDEALDIVSPKDTSKVLRKGISSGRGSIDGMLGRASIEPDARTIRAAEAAAGIVKKGKTGIENANAVRKEIGVTAEKLKSDLSNLEVAPLVQRQELDSILAKALNEIGENPTLVGNAELSAHRILNKFKSFLPEKTITASDLLDARKKLDKWMESQSGGSTVFDPAYENAKTIALRSIRQEANDLIAVKAPTVAVKELLARQSALYDALENISAKATKEVGTTALDRAAKRHPLLSGFLKDTLRFGTAGVGIGTAGSFFSKD